MNYANVCIELGNLKAALRAYQKAISIDPNVAEAHNNLGILFEKLNRPEKALESFKQALALEPTSPRFTKNVAQNCLALIEYAENAEDLEASHDIAEAGLRLMPQSRELQEKQAFSLMIRGRVREGMQIAPDPNIKFMRLPVPDWSGGAVSGGRLLVRSEQGVGDQLIFLSALTDLTKEWARITVECDHRFVPLFTRSFPRIEFVGWREPPVDRLLQPDITAQMPMRFLCAMYRPDPESFPEAKPYLVADPERTDIFRNKYHVGADARVIGISWCSSNTPYAGKKSIPLDKLAQTLSKPGVRLLSLQYGDHGEEITRVENRRGVEIMQDPELDPLADLDAFASAVAACDLVVSSDNATVHFAGALGVPTWVILPAAPYWFWFLEREDSPWYGSVRLFRRTGKESSWRPVLARVGRSLQNWVSAP
jgi:hypothetical protein